MPESDIGSRTASVELLRSRNGKRRLWYEFWWGLSLLWSRLGARPAFVFILLSFAFGAAISVVVPPLRGPDEIAHFLRIYSYTRGSFLPPAEVDGRKGIFIDRELHSQLSFFKNAGERFLPRRRVSTLRFMSTQREAFSGRLPA
jgi:hypothetical protein